ncbi:hypothetical protein BDF20DRAFT_800872, partial [Mycotypha africana]|uniref:uncharacterized protein n=1 Tax=Mycotypha africana TaxID=64632 RepID=UPI002301872F
EGEQDVDYDNSGDDCGNIPDFVQLDLRGEQTIVDRETLVNLPESLLIAMFPNGLILVKKEATASLMRVEENHTLINEEEELMLAYVDFNSSCLKYVLDVFQQAQQKVPEYRSSPLFMNKQAIIVLREELEYYCITQQQQHSQKQLKIAAGEYLTNNNQVFSALLKNIEREQNVSEQHLIDMLCNAGFTKEDKWAFRELEPNRTCVMSISLVPLKYSNDKDTANKLLLFWRKPARKCWWEGTTIELQKIEKPIRLWSRRTWTLELALI